MKKYLVLFHNQGVGDIDILGVFDSLEKAQDLMHRNVISYYNEV